MGVKFLMVLTKTGCNTVNLITTKPLKTIQNRKFQYNRSAIFAIAYRSSEMFRYHWNILDESVKSRSF